MLYGFVSRTRQKPTWLQLKHCILRNFGGLPEEIIQPVDIFAKNLVEVVTRNEQVSSKKCIPLFNMHVFLLSMFFVCAKSMLNTKKICKNKS